MMLFAAADVNGPKAYQGAISGVLAGTTLSLGVSWVKATFVAGVVAAAVALLPARDGEEVGAALEKEGRIASAAIMEACTFLSTSRWQAFGVCPRDEHCCDMSARPDLGLDPRQSYCYRLQCGETGLVHFPLIPKCQDTVL